MWSDTGGTVTPRGSSSDFTQGGSPAGVLRRIPRIQYPTQSIISILTCKLLTGVPTNCPQNRQLLKLWENESKHRSRVVYNRHTPLALHVIPLTCGGMR